MPNAVPIPLAMLTRPPTREADESAVPRMIAVLFAGTKMPRPRPTRASCGTTVAWFTGTTTDAPMTEEHSSPIKTPKQLIIVVLLAFAVPITLAALISQLVTSGEKGIHEDDSKVLARIQPVANVVLAEASGPKGMLSGEQVYTQVCKTCHETGLAGAPKLGDKAA